MMKETIRLVPQRLLGFCLVKQEIIENCQDVNDRNRKMNISVIKSKVGGGGKIGLSKR